MRFEDQVYFGCAAYSMIHPNRAAELNHLFLVIGNGYEWTKSGDLVAVCDAQFYKNGKPMSLNAAINRVFRNRKKNAEFRKRYDRNQKRREKRALTHSKTCPSVTGCNCYSDPHDTACCFFFPDQRKCTCGAQARIDAAKPLDSKLDKLIEDAIAAMKKAKEADPVGFEQKRLKQLEEFKASKRQWREEKKWEYRIPADIEERVAYQRPVAGAHGGYNHWYPACEYSKIVTFPENIKNDWLLGIIEVCELVLSNPPVADGRTSNERTVNETLELCRKAHKRAVEMAMERAIVKAEKSRTKRSGKGIK